MKEFFKKIFNVKSVVLTEVQEKISDIPPEDNVLILSSCGSGKTEGAYYLALQWGGKTIYVQPQKTLATSICERLKKYNQLLGYKDTWTVQHSTIQGDPFLSNHYVVTTIDQVLAGYLGIGVQAFMKGKNVVRSNFIFDEIQLFEPEKTLKTTVQMLDAIYKNGNRFIIMTATMPEYLINFLSKRYNMKVIVTERPSVENRTVKIHYEEQLNIEAVIGYSHKQIIMCNSQREQIQIGNKIKDPSRCIFLNSKLLPRDRERVEEEVMKYFGKESGDNNKILISTQVIEAGMDISAHRMYSSVSPIDSLIQRDGRECRWGGIGEIICFKGTYKNIYEEELVLETIKLLEWNQNIEFTWDIQKQWVNQVLNSYYKKNINAREIKKQRPRLKNGTRNELIREINNVNVIVDYNPSVQSFKREGVSIHIDNLKNIMASNSLYILNRGELKTASFRDINQGDTVVIKGENCFYDEVGFRLEEGEQCIEFPLSNKAKKGVEFIDYIEEPWIVHATEVRSIMKERLERERFSPYVIENMDKLADIGGLHDIGKLDVVWQGPLWANAQTVPLAHFPFRKSTSLIFKERNHAVISAVALRDYVDYIQLNMLLQHHKRYIDDGTCVHLKEYKLDTRYKECLLEYGFTHKLKESDKNRDLTFNEDVIHPAHKQWVDFLYVVGTLMESDIEAIKRVQAEGIKKKDKEGVVLP